MSFLNCDDPIRHRRLWIGSEECRANISICPAVTIGEIQAGIELTREQDAGKAKELEVWLNQVLATYSVLAVDAAAFREWAKLMHRRSDTLMQDAMIAAVAMVHRLVVATRNVRDFEPFGVGIINPFE